MRYLYSVGALAILLVTAASISSPQSFSSVTLMLFGLGLSVNLMLMAVVDAIDRGRD